MREPAEAGASKNSADVLVARLLVETYSAYYCLLPGRRHWVRRAARQRTSSTQRCTTRAGGGRGDNRASVEKVSILFRTTFSVVFTRSGSRFSVVFVRVLRKNQTHDSREGSYPAAPVIGYHPAARQH